MFKEDFTPRAAKAGKTAKDSLGSNLDTDNLTGFRFFEKGETLFSEGERGAEAYVIKSGNVRIP